MDTTNAGTSDLERDLGLRLLGETFYLQALGQLSPAAVEQASPLPGWSRKHLVLHMLFNGEAMLRLIDWAKTGVENPMYPSREWRDAQIEEAHSHTSARDAIAMSDEIVEEITEELATMTEEAWNRPLRTHRGPITAEWIPWMRGREAWVHSLDLGIGMSALDFPTEVLDRMLTDIAGEWDRRDETVAYDITLTDRPEVGVWHLRTGSADVDTPATDTVEGPAGAVFAHLSGRGWPGSLDEPSGLPTPPAWL
ncbi:maleylpyruvate isomerase family mycothiol-dependent enzyme [Brevibacterium litoralis]|uniref:maleylpyruvate isomerase family mycothiol-dependent enzyme n=1 Tax=Brevibacterium litoralis TaxID=3138935 RepID=UPI0032EE5B5B